MYDTTPFISESIREVVHDALIDAVILVAVVVLLFLQNWRSAIIPLVAVPVAIIGTFAVMAAMGFSLNNLTLFGLVLAIGIVVDDAIVVVEAVEQQIEHGLSPRDATIRAMELVSGPVDRRGTGAERRLRSLRVHHGDHRPVLPAVRPDDRRLDGDFGLQLADAEPGPDGPAAAAQGPRRTAPPLPWFVFPLVGGWLGWRSVDAVDGRRRRHAHAAARPLCRGPLEPCIDDWLPAIAGAAGEPGSSARRCSARSTAASNGRPTSTLGWWAGCCG